VDLAAAVVEMNEYLNVIELHQLTGLARPGKQSEWLKSHGIPHRVDGTRVKYTPKSVAIDAFVAINYENRRIVGACRWRISAI